MSDLFRKPIQTREHAIRTMPVSTCVALIDATRKALPCGSSFRFPHQFLNDVRQQLIGGYKRNLSHKQTQCVLRFADEAGVRLDTFTTKEKHHAEG